VSVPASIAAELATSWASEGPGSKLAPDAAVHRLALEDEGGPDRHGWPEPALLGVVEDVPFPTEVLPPDVRAHIESVAQATQTPVEMPALFALSAIAATVQAKAEIQVRPGWLEPLCVYSAVVMEPGERKTPVGRHIFAPLVDWEHEHAESTYRERQRTADLEEMLSKQIDAAKRKGGRDNVTEGDLMTEIVALRDRMDGLPPTEPPRLLADDVTHERLLDLMAQNHGRIAILTAEPEIFHIMSGRYTEGVPVLGIFKKAWSGSEPIRDDRMGRKGSYVRRPALTMGVAVQPHVLDDIRRQRSFRGEGLLARFLWSMPDSRLGFRATGPDAPAADKAAALTYARRVDALLALNPAGTDRGGEWIPHVLELSHTAAGVFFDWESEVEVMLRPGETLYGVRDWGAKIAGQTVRLAGLLQLATVPEFGPISGDAMDGAIRLARYLIPQALTLFDEIDGDPDLALARYVFGKLDTVTTERDLLVRVRGKVGLAKMDELRAVLDVLEGRDLIYRDTPNEGQPGRPSVRIRRTPRALTSIHKTHKTPGNGPGTRG